MQAQHRGRFKDNCGTDQPARADEDRTQTGDDAIRRTEIGDRFRERLRISSWCLASTDSATTARAPPGPASRATGASRCRNRTARSRTAGSYQDRDRGKECPRILEFAMHRIKTGPNRVLDRDTLAFPAR